MKKSLKRLLLAAPGFESVCRLLTRSLVRAVMYHRFCPVTSDDPGLADRHNLELQAANLAAHHARWRPVDHLAAQLTGERRARPSEVLLDRYPPSHIIV